ncbi:MAG: hypothetical protein LBP52_09175 [Burkholderiaceae bacterium]|jgi:hypothetical protein|nr:hypothetical protein [Burkholderiaceae bacterium]
MQNFVTCARGGSGSPASGGPDLDFDKENTMEVLAYFAVLMGALSLWETLNAKYIAVAIFIISICIVLWTGSGSRPRLKLGLVALLLGAVVLAMLHQPPPEFDIISRTEKERAKRQLFSNRSDKAEEMCLQESRAHTAHSDNPYGADPIPARGLTLEEAGFSSYELVDLLLWQELAFVEAKVFAGDHGQGHIVTDKYKEKNNWPVQQPPGQYVRLQLAAEGTPGCLAPSAMPEAARREWDERYKNSHDGSRNAYLHHRERTEGKLCLWMGAIDAPTASVRLDYAAYPGAAHNEPQGRFRLLDAQTGAVLAARTVNNLGDNRSGNCWGYSELTRLVKPENYQMPPRYDEAEQAMFSNRERKALAMCEQESRSRPVPVQTRAITLEEKGIHADELVNLLLQKNLDFVEIKVFSEKNEWQGRIATAGLEMRYPYDDQPAWNVNSQSPGQYVRLQLAAEGTPGCLAPDAMPKGARKAWHDRYRPHFRERERAQGGPLCLWLGNAGAPTAPVRLDYKPSGVARSEPQGQYRLVNAQTGAVLATRTVSNRGDRVEKTASRLGLGAEHDGCDGYSGLTALLSAPAAAAAAKPPQ